MDRTGDAIETRRARTAIIASGGNWAHRARGSGSASTGAVVAKRSGSREMDPNDLAAVGSERLRRGYAAEAKIVTRSERGVLIWEYLLRRSEEVRATTWRRRRGSADGARLQRLPRVIVRFDAEVYTRELHAALVEAGHAPRGRMMLCSLEDLSASWNGVTLADEPVHAGRAALRPR